MAERKKTSEVNIDFSATNFKCIAIGDIGTGKSSFAATFPTPGYIFNFDNKVAAYTGEDWTYTEIPTSALGWVIAEKEKGIVAKEVREGKFRTVVIDSTTSLHTLAVERAMQIDPKRSEIGGPIWNVHYQMAATLTESFIRTVLSWPCNVVVVIHYEAVRDEQGNIVAYQPMLPGKSVVKIPSLFDEIYRTFTRTKAGVIQYRLSTVPRGLYVAARSGLRGLHGLLDEELDNSYQSVLENYTKNLTAKQTKGDQK
jgi:hypothetical protein